jgi:hypothetical protein
MFMLRFVTTTVSVFVAALVGNWVGERIRSMAMGEPSQELRPIHTNDQGEVIVAANPVWTNLVPALLVGLVSKPRWLGAFIAGVIVSGFVGDRYERRMFELFSGPCCDEEVEEA